MKKEVNFDEISNDLLKQLQKGAFLTVKEGNKVNTMTIAWGSIGFIWNKPVFTTLVRYSRYTYELIDKADNFTVSFPVNNNLKKELAFCGTKSGRDYDKVRECNLTLAGSDKVASPVIDGCSLHIECKIVYKHGMEKENLCDEIRGSAYANDDYHVMYFGEIIKAYITE